MTKPITKYKLCRVIVQSILHSKISIPNITTII